MDTFTRRYLIFLGTVLVLILAIWALQWGPAVSNLNKMLEQDKTVSGYPFPFHVMDLENGIATVASPRSPEVSVLKFIGIAFPDLEGVDGNDPQVIEAQKQLAEVQNKVKKLLVAQPDVDSVQWKVDTRWFEKHGVYFQ